MAKSAYIPSKKDVVPMMSPVRNPIVGVDIYRPVPVVVLMAPASKSD